jgi:hypothetical protein
MQPYDVNDPLFLQQLGVLQAEGIRKAINDNSVVTYSGFQETNTTIENSANFIGNKIGSVANMLTSSLEKGFNTLNSSLIKIDNGIETANLHLSNIRSGVNTANTHLSNINAGIQNVNNNLIVLGKLVGQGFSVLHNQLSQSNKQLGQILQELKIPETQRERRYHIEEGTKYLIFALQNGDALYFDDAFEEFNTALTFEKKDWFSWFNIGLIHLRSKEHINLQKAIDAFKRMVHYGRAEIAYTKNENLEYKIDEAHLYMAEAYYLQQEFKNAVLETEQCLHTKDKADFMKVKYLSATNEKQDKQLATEILSKLINQNPYITLQILEDDDILKNEQVLSLLEKIRVEKNKDARDIFTRIKLGDTQEVKQIELLISTGAYLDAYEAIELAKALDNAIEDETHRAREGLQFIKEHLNSKNMKTEINDIEYLISKRTLKDAVSAKDKAYKIVISLGDILHYCDTERHNIDVLQQLLKEAPVCVIKELVDRNIGYKIRHYWEDPDEYRTEVSFINFKLNDLIRKIRK